jgi:hypothetical protein
LYGAQKWVTTKVMREGWLVHCLFFFLSRGRDNEGERD